MIALYFSWEKKYSDVIVLKDDFPELGYKGPGWYRSESDTALVVQVMNGLRVFVWNGSDPRESLKYILGLPEYEGT